MIKNFINKRTLIKIIVIFSFGLVSRMIINNYFEINVFMDFFSYISICYYLVLASFITFIHNYVDNLNFASVRPCNIDNSSNSKNHNKNSYYNRSIRQNSNSNSNSNSSKPSTNRTNPIKNVRSNNNYTDTWPSGNISYDGNSEFSIGYYYEDRIEADNYSKVQNSKNRKVEVDSKGKGVDINRLSRIPLDFTLSPSSDGGYITYPPTVPTTSKLSNLSTPSTSMSPLFPTNNVSNMVNTNNSASIISEQTFDSNQASLGNPRNPKGSVYLPRDLSRRSPVSYNPYFYNDVPE